MKSFPWHFLMTLNKGFTFGGTLPGCIPLGGIPQKKINEVYIKSQR